VNAPLTLTRRQFFARSAMILHLPGMDQERLPFKFQGRYFRLTDVHGGVVKGFLV
jgi:hypothetical protein